MNYGQLKAEVLKLWTCPHGDIICAYCLRSIVTRNGPHLHHLIRRGQGMTIDRIWNVAPLHNPLDDGCHLNVHTRLGTQIVFQHLCERLGKGEPWKYRKMIETKMAELMKDPPPLPIW